MQRRAWYGRDFQLTARMGITMFLLAAVYLAFFALIVTRGVRFWPLVIIGAVMLIVQFFYSDKLALATAGAREVTPQEAPRLHGIVDRLSAMGNLPKPRVHIIQSGMPNAFATGHTPKSASIAVTTGLLDRLDDNELVAVIGHELTHIGNRDMMVMTVATFFAMIASFIVHNVFFMSVLGGGGGRRDRNDGAGAFIIIYLASLLVWVISFLLIRTLSRYREYAADRGSAILTGQPAQLESALLKISDTMMRIPQRDLRQAEGLAALYFFPPVNGQTLMELLATHPSIEHRIERLRKMQQEMA